MAWLSRPAAARDMLVMTVALLPLPAVLRNAVAEMSGHIFTGRNETGPGPHVNVLIQGRSRHTLLQAFSHPPL